MRAHAIDVLLVAAARRRAPDRLDLPVEVAPADPPIAELVAAARAACLGRFSASPDTFRAVRAVCWLSGGEPTLRSDLPELVAALAAVGPVGLDTDGVVLSEKVARGLAAVGLSRVRVPFPCARADAQDWLMMRPGATKRAAAAIRACVAAGLPVDADVVVTRPTAPHLEETVEVLARLGVAGVRFRRLTASGPAAGDFVALSPRFGLTEPYLEAAVAAAVRRGLDVGVVGFPACAAPKASAYAREERWVGVGDVAAWMASPRAAQDRRRDADGHEAGTCARCPGPPRCGGAPADYVAWFGWSEIVSEDRPSPSSAGDPAGDDPGRPSPTRHAGTGRKLGVAPPPVRGERRPATRVKAAVQQALRGDLGGDPLAGTPVGSVGDEVHLSWTADEPTRDVRLRLVRAAQVGAPRLVLHGEGLMRHPAVLELLLEATRLSFPEVVVVASAEELDVLPEPQLRRLKTKIVFRQVSKSTIP